VVGEDLGEGAGFVLLQGVDLLKELDEGLGVVACLVHVLETEPVTSPSKLREKLEEGHGDGELGGFVDAVAGQEPWVKMMRGMEPICA